VILKTVIGCFRCVWLRLEINCARAGLGTPTYTILINLLWPKNKFFSLIVHISLTHNTYTGTRYPELNMSHVVLGSAPDFVCSEITPMWNEEKQKICQRLASAFLRLWLYHLRSHVIFHMKRESRYRYSLARRLVLDEAFLPICYFKNTKMGY